MKLDREESDKGKGTVTAVYRYETVFEIDKEPLQRAGKIQIEATSFTVSEPIEEVTIEPIIYKLANADEKNIFDKNFSVGTIKLNIIKLERMFIDKIFAAEFYFLRGMYTDMAKHIYDISVLMNNEKIKSLLNNKELMSKLISYKREEEKIRKRRD